MLIYTIRNNDKREQRYQETINDNHAVVKDSIKRMKTIEDVKKDTEEIKKEINK